MPATAAPMQLHVGLFLFHRCCTGFQLSSFTFLCVVVLPQYRIQSQGNGKFLRTFCGRLQVIPTGQYPPPQPRATASIPCHGSGLQRREPLLASSPLRAVGISRCAVKGSLTRTHTGTCANHAFAEATDSSQLYNKIYQDDTKTILQ